jgi:hypothetical protein
MSPAGGPAEFVTIDKFLSTFLHTACLSQTQQSPTIRLLNVLNITDIEHINIMSF